jgi:cytochrome c oxidase subunit 3
MNQFEELSPNDAVEPFLLKRREPYDFMLRLGIIGMSLVFVAITLLYLNRVNEQVWTSFRLPKAFWLSTILLILSSLTIQKAYQCLQTQLFKQYRFYLYFTFLLASGFILVQILGWQQLMTQNIFLQNNLAGAFIYVLTGLHIAHLLGGIILLLKTLSEAQQNKNYVDAFVYSVNPPNQLKIKLIVRYWHFVDILWIYLFLFFLYFHS